MRFRQRATRRRRCAHTPDNGPGVYIQELPNPVQPIVGVPTSVAAFYGQAPQGMVDYPFQVNSWADYENEFGGLNRGYPLSYAVYLFFLNGGRRAGGALQRRHPSPPRRSCPKTSRSRPTRPATGQEQLTATVDMGNLFDSANQFNLTITPNRRRTSQSPIPAASLNKGSPQYLATLLAASQFVDPAASTIGRQCRRQILQRHQDGGLHFAIECRTGTSQLASQPPQPGRTRQRRAATGAGAARRGSRNAGRGRSRERRRRAGAAGDGRAASLARGPGSEDWHLCAAQGGHLQHPVSSGRPLDHLRSGADGDLEHRRRVLRRSSAPC